MPSVISRVPGAATVPKQRVFIGGVWDPFISCVRVTHTAHGSNAVFDCPFMVFSSNETRYITNEVIVYAWNDGESDDIPIFRGLMDRTTKEVRGGRVSFSASSHYAALRSRNIQVRESLAYIDENDPSMTFAVTARGSFPDYNPYVKNHRQFANWTPISIFSYFYSIFMETWFKERVFFEYSLNLNNLSPYTIDSWRWEVVDDTPTLVSYAYLKNGIGSQTIRAVTWGQLIDYLAKLIPGCQVYETFTNVGTTVKFGLPFENGAIIGTAGYGNFDWRDLGANIEELDCETEIGSSINRVVCVGSPAECTISLSTEMLDNDGDIIGLVPDWEIFDINAPDESEARRVHGISPGNEYMTVIPQRIIRVAQNRELAMRGSSSYIPGYERVGRCYRLPNWFTFAKVSRGSDMFNDPSSGWKVDMQVFVQGTISEGNNRNFRYEWVQYEENFKYEPNTGTLELSKIPLVSALKDDEENPGMWVIDTDANPPQVLSKVVVTFTYSHDNFTPYADTLHQDQGFINPERLTAIPTGQPMVFTRDDLGYSQITNINFPLKMLMKEYLLMDRGDIAAAGRSIIQRNVEQVKDVVYDNLIIAAYLDGSGVIKNETYAEPRVMRNDLQYMHGLARYLLNWTAKRTRAFGLTFPIFAKACKRGYLLGVVNMPGYVNDMDVIDYVEHDLALSRTRIQTTNDFVNSVSRYVVTFRDDDKYAM